MEAKDKELLLKDLCARLPYGVLLHIEDGVDSYIADLTDIGYINQVGKLYINGLCFGTIEPYLRPLSSMTEEERKEFIEVAGGNCSFIDIHGNFYIDFGEFICEGSPVSLSRIVYVINWLYAHHFDVNNLIPKGLALEAHKDMYNVKD